MQVSRIDRESASVFSLVLVSAAGEPLAAPLPGQFVVLRLPIQSGAPPVLRSYSLSGLPGTGHYRVSIKQEEKGLGSLSAHSNKAGEQLGGKRAPWQLHTPFGQRAGRAPQRGSWSDAGFGNAARLGGREVKPAGLVALRGTQSGGASIPERVSCFATRIEVRPQLHPVQQAGTKRPKGYRFRCRRAPSRFRIRRDRHSA